VEVDRTVLNAAARFLSGPCRAVEVYPEMSLRFDAGALFVGSDWRVRRERDVVASSDATRERLAEFVMGGSVTSLATTGRYHDLVIRFDNSTVLETWDTTDRFEHWRIAGTRPDDLIVGGPGELWSSFVPDERL
jgi:hypothetical protein